MSRGWFILELTTEYGYVPPVEVGCAVTTVSSTDVRVTHIAERDASISGASERETDVRASYDCDIHVSGRSEEKVTIECTRN